MSRTTMKAPYLDKVCSAERLDDVTATGWGGDQDDTYVEIATNLPCRYEITFRDTSRTETSDVSVITLWLGISDDYTPQIRDHVLVDGLVLDVIQAHTWTTLRGKPHHHELRCKDIADA